MVFQHRHRTRPNLQRPAIAPVKTPNEIIKWLRNNLGPHAAGGLTSSDTAALIASVNLSNLINCDQAPRELFQAYHAIVVQILPHNLGLPQVLKQKSQPTLK